jgi:transketolase
MKKWTLILLISIISIGSFAQNGHCRMNRKKIKAERIAYITQDLNLTVKEAQAFWPVYNKYTDALEKLRKENHQRIRNAFDDKSNNYNDILKKQYLSFDEEAQIKKEFQNALKKVLSAEKIIKLYQSEGNFKRNLIKKMRK